VWRRTSLDAEAAIEEDDSEVWAALGATTAARRRGCCGLFGVWAFWALASWDFHQFCAKHLDENTYYRWIALKDGCEKVLTFRVTRESSWSATSVSWAVGPCPWCTTCRGALCRGRPRVRPTLATCTTRDQGAAVPTPQVADGESTRKQIRKLTPPAPAKICWSKSPSVQAPMNRPEDY
jgi:hypothetical protein